MTLFPVAERFVSINGEGRKAGALSCFIRLRGCNLVCNYCDTRWACEPDARVEELSAEELKDWVISTGIECVTLTGGEPLITKDVEELIRTLSAVPGAEIEIETNGAVPLKGYTNLGDNVFFTMDLKCPGSGMCDHNCYDNLALLRDRDVIKFVISDRGDLDWMREIIHTYRLTGRCGIFAGAVFGRITPEEIVDYLGSYRMNEVRLQLQLHKYIWDPDKRGV